MKVSVIIKAFNEEKNIARTIESCIDAVKGFESEIVLADSLSQDGTVEIASQYPVKIVQLLRPEDRGCGIAPQLGYQYCSGDFIYLIDGDMVLHADFLRDAIKLLESSPSLAGVGGLVREMNINNLEFIARSARESKHLRPGIVSHLDGGGLYRRSAIESVGYFSDRNLHAFEEFDLATRLRVEGWKLARIDMTAVDHYGYTIDAYSLLWRRIKGKYTLGAGELLRGAISKPTLTEVLRSNRTIHISAVVGPWIIGSLLIPSLFLDLPQSGVVTILALVMPICVMSLRRRSFSLGLYAVISWIIYTIGSVRGFLRPRVDPNSWIASRTVQSKDVRDNSCVLNQWR